MKTKVVQHVPRINISMSQSQPHWFPAKNYHKKRDVLVILGEGGAVLALIYIRMYVCMLL